MFVLVVQVSTFNFSYAQTKKDAKEQITEVFNKQIKIFVENEQDMYYLDFNPVTLNTESGTVKSWLLNGKNTCDHHYKRWIYAIMIIIKRLVIKS